MKNRSDENKKLFCKQRNLCVSLLRKSKNDYFTKLNKKQITDKIQFWKTNKSFLSRKVQSSDTINLTKEDHSLITNWEELQKK